MSNELLAAEATPERKPAFIRLPRGGIISCAWVAAIVPYERSDEDGCYKVAVHWGGGHISHASFMSKEERYAWMQPAIEAVEANG